MKDENKDLIDEIDKHKAQQDVEKKRPKVQNTFNICILFLYSHFSGNCHTLPVNHAWIIEIAKQCLQ